MSKRFVLLSLAAMLASPAALAAWSGKGAHEPDTSLDSGGFMFVNPDASATSGRNVYFNGFAGFVTLAAITTVNPNLGSPAIQSQVIMPVQYNAQALLGVWKDCNNDGFIGFGDNALFEYRSELLNVPPKPGVAPAGTSICAPIPLVDANPATPAFDYPQHTGILMHNDGQWVREYIPIGPETTINAHPDANPFNIPDNGARVWADWGVPGSPPGYICYFLTHPKGSFDTVGNMIGLADCFGRQKIDTALRGVTNNHPTAAAAYATLKATPNPWGQSSDASAVAVADCTTPIAGPTKVPGTQIWVTVPRPTPGQGSGTSVAGTLSDADATFTDCDRTKSSSGADTLMYATTEDINNQYGRKTVNDWVLKFTEDVRPGPAGTATNVLGRGASKDLGTRPLPEGFWRAGAISLVGRNPVVNIDALGPQPVQYITHYAYLSAAAISAYSLQLPGTVGTYGTAPCGTSIGTGQPDQGFWSCDPDVWWPTNLQKDPIAQGIIAGQSVFMGVRVGHSFQLRDVDCYDTSAKPLRDEGVYYPMVVSGPCV